MTNARVLLFSLGMLLFIPLSAGQQLGCCANLYAEEAYTAYCTEGELTIEQCCPPPPAGGYNAESTYWPDSPSQCKNLYWAATCDALPTSKCYVGCCYDEVYTTGCIATQEDMCKGWFTAQDYDDGFPVEQRKEAGNPCYNKQGVAAIAACSGPHVTTCSDYNEQDPCVEHECYWCSSQVQCLANCDSCTSQPKDSNGDHRCDTQVQVYCDEAWRDESKQDCIGDNTNCKWCPGTTTCMYDCDLCFGLDFDTNPVDQVCDSGIIPECNDGDDNDLDGKKDMADFCCTEASDNTEDNECSCTGGGSFCCTVYEEQCADAFGIIIKEDYFDETSCAGVCCDRPCYEIPACWDGIRIKDNSATFPAGYHGSYCICDEVQQDVNNPDVNDKFCCEGYTQDEPCGSTYFYGSVKDPDQKPLFPAAFTLQGTYTHSFINKPDGTFYRYVEEGTYTLTVTMNGYQTFTQTITIAGEEKREDITLLPIERLCNLDWPPITLTATPTKCRKEIQLDWKYEYCRDYVELWTVYRDGKQIRSSTYKNLDNVVDTGVSWGTKYNYYIIAQHTGGQNTSNTVELSPGDEQCEDKCGKEQFCLQDNAVRAYCSDTNKVTNIEVCEGSVCVGPDAGGITYCRLPDDCELTGLPQPNIFGMFYERDQCLYDNSVPRYCYLDYSSTTADSCKKCDSSMFCYDYLSADACGTDNCQVTKQGKYYECTWYSDDYFYHELGKGICFAPKYDGTEYCNKCGKKDVLFANVHCSSTACDLLGACYSDENQDSCHACNNNVQTRCDDFKDERSCIGSSGIVKQETQEFEIQKCTANPSPVTSGDSFVLSNDACSLGACKWDGQNCFKDADDDGTPDCIPGDTNCQRDTMPPETTVTLKPEKVSLTGGGEVKFSISDIGWGEQPDPEFESYFCVDSSDSCCPDMQIVDNTIVLRGDGSIPSLVGVKNPSMYLRFFSVDGYRNVEAIKHTTINVDTQRPTIYITHKVTNKSGTVDKSDLTLTFTVDEIVDSCNDELVEIESSQRSAKMSNVHIDPSEPPLVVVYETMPDGWYEYSIECKDSFGNVNSTEIRYIHVDRLHNIIKESPLGQRFLPTEPVKLYFETEGGQLDCYYQMQKPSTGVRTKISPTGSVSKYQKQLGTLSSGHYLYSVECEQSGTVVDSTTLFFVVDGLAPETYLFYEDYSGHYSPFDPSSWYKSVKVKFECDDTNPIVEPTPGPFGCDSILYCTDYDGLCTPSKKLSGDYGFVDLSKETKSFYIRYNSKDSGGNEESIKSQLVRVDETPPVVEISYPKDGEVVNNPHINIRGAWYDNLPEAVITIAWSSETQSDFVTLKSTSSQFSSDITLFQGENSITVTARDTGIHGGNNLGPPVTVTAYHDTIGPEFQGAQITNHKGERIENTEQKSADYAEEIHFSASIDDVQWTREVASAALTVECADQMQCSSYLNTFSMKKNGTQFTYDLNPLQSGILRTGPFSVKYNAEDKYGNSNDYNQTFFVTDSSTLPAMVFNHLWERIDDKKHNARYVKKISFVAAPSKFDIINSVVINVKCINQIECGDYSRDFALIRQASTYNYTLDPLSSGVLITGPYNVTFTSTDNYGKKQQKTLSFIVDDTSVLGARIFNYLGQRVDDRSHDVEYSREIHFNFSSSEPANVKSVQLTVVCANTSKCGEYHEDFVMEMHGDSFTYTHVPQKNEHAIYLPDVGTYRALFIIKDVFDMYKTVLKNFTVVDSQGAFLDIEVKSDIYNTVTGLPKVGIGKTSCKWYEIVVNSNKPLESLALKADVFRYTNTDPPPIDFANLPVPVISQNRDVWTYQLCVPYENPVYRYLRGNNTQFLLEATDMRKRKSSEGNIIAGRYFEIDTHGGDPPKLVTDLPVTYYTNKNSLTIIGLTNPQEPSFQTYMNLSNNVLETTASPASQIFGQDVLFLAATAGASAVEVFGNQEILFQQGRSVRFEHHNRSNGLHYKIASADFSVSRQTTKISLQSVLEQGVTDQEKVYVFSREKPTGWFTFSTTLTTQGAHELSIWAVDEMGNIGLPTERTVVYDTQPLVIDSYTPLDKTVSAEKRPKISISVSDESTWVNISSIILTINNASYSCKQGLKCTTKGNHVIVEYSPRADLPDGVYHVVFEGADIIGNRKQFSWEFTVDSTVPVLKSFQVNEANYHPSPKDRWYTRNNRVSFKAVFEPSNISGSIMLKEAPDVTFECDSINGYEVNCMATSALADGDYQLTAEVKKYLGPGWGSTGVLKYSVTVDTVPPDISFDPTFPLSKRRQLVSGQYSDKNMGQEDEIMIQGDQLMYPVKATLSKSSFEGEVTLREVPEGTYPITATAYDKAGNTNTAQASLIYDLSCAPIQLTSVTSTYKDYTVVKKTPAYYNTNAGTKKWGIAITGLAENGALRVYTSYMTNTNTTSTEVLQRTISVTGAFAANITLGQSNGENYVRLVNTDLAGNNNSLAFTIFSDVQGPLVPFVEFEGGTAPVAQIGSTGWHHGGGVVQEPEYCMQFVSNIERDSCLINLLLKGKKNVCSYISDYYLKISCEAVS